MFIIRLQDVNKFRARHRKWVNNERVCRNDDWVDDIILDGMFRSFSVCVCAFKCRFFSLCGALICKKEFFFLNFISCVCVCVWVSERHFCVSRFFQKKYNKKIYINLTHVCVCAWREFVHNLLRHCGLALNSVCSRLQHTQKKAHAQHVVCH